MKTLDGVLIVLGKQKPIQVRTIFLKNSNIHIINFVTFKMFKKTDILVLEKGATNMKRGKT